MELKDIYALWDRFEQSAVTEMELDFQGVHLKLSQKAGPAVAAPSDFVPSPVAAKAEAALADKSENNSTMEVHKEIKAPLLGVFYCAPAPGEKPFVEVGQSFKKGDVIGIIEAMKMMNEILASEDGVVSDILVQDGELVEYDQTILTYR